MSKVSEYCFPSLSAQYCDRSEPELCPTLLERLEGFFIMQITCDRFEDFSIPKCKVDGTQMLGRIYLIIINGDLQKWHNRFEKLTTGNLFKDFWISK